MHRTFCCPIYPTCTQELDLLEVMECLRLLFNGCIQERREAWQKLRTSVTLYDQMKSLTAIRAHDESYAAIASEIARSALKRVDKAFKDFFRRCKAGDTPGFPRFKKFGRYKSFTFTFGKNTIVGDGRSARLHIPNFGDVRINLYRPLKGRPLEVTVRVDGTGQWWAAISCDLGAAPLAPEPSTLTPDDVLGADMGITSLVAFSDGTTLLNPRHFEKSAAKLKRRQQEYARKRKGSRSKARALRLVAKTHQHIANQRKDYHRKSACDIMARCKAVVFEDLNIAGLTRAQLGKHVNLAAWRQYQQIVACKAEEAGKLVVRVEPRHTSQLCSGCGVLVPKELDERWHHCDACGTSLDRDVNAAKTIRFRGMATLGMSVAEVFVAKAAKTKPKVKKSSVSTDDQV